MLVSKDLNDINDFIWGEFYEFKSFKLIMNLS